MKARKCIYAAWCVTRGEENISLCQRGNSLPFCLILLFLLLVLSPLSLSLSIFLRFPNFGFCSFLLFFCVYLSLFSFSPFPVLLPSFILSLFVSSWFFSFICPAFVAAAADENGCR